MYLHFYYFYLVMTGNGEGPQQILCWINGVIKERNPMEEEMKGWERVDKDKAILWHWTCKPNPMGQAQLIICSQILIDLSCWNVLFSSLLSHCITLSTKCTLEFSTLSLIRISF